MTEKLKMEEAVLKRQKLVELDKQYIWHPYTQMDQYIETTDPIVVDKAEGIYLTDVDGTTYIDGNASWWVNILGHNHPRLMAAICKQTTKLAHCSLAGITHEGAALLGEKLLPMIGKPFTKLFFSDNGSTAVESAVRMAYQYWQIKKQKSKRRFVTFKGAFHGETVGAASVSGVDVFHNALGPLLFDRILLPSPGEIASGEQSLEDIFSETQKILEQNAGEIAAIIIEPLVQGAAGMLMYPPSYLSKLRELCDELDILLIVDEVFVGYGRTGTFMAHHQAHIKPDIICLAKGFSGGVLPMAGTVTTDRIFDTFSGGPENTLWYGHSFTGNPMGCAVALETLRVFEDDKIIEGLPPKCAALQKNLDSIKDHPWVQDVRRTGMISAFTLKSPMETPKSTGYLDTAGWRFYDGARKRGAFLRPLGNVVYFVLPLTISPRQINSLFGIVNETLHDVFPQ